MKMKQQRELKKNPPEPRFKHTCGCMEDVEYLQELPKYADCHEPEYFEKVNGEWIDVSDQVESSWS